MRRAPVAERGTGTTSSYALQQAGLTRVAASGGTPAAVTQLAPGQARNGGRSSSLTVAGSVPILTGILETHGVYLGSLDGGAPTSLLPGETVAVAPFRATAARAQRGTGGQPPRCGARVVGDEPILLAQLALTETEHTHSAFSISDAGCPAYRPGGVATRQLVWPTAQESHRRVRVARQCRPANAGARGRRPCCGITRAPRQSDDTWILRRRSKNPGEVSARSCQ